jgi:hypothetical protein
MINKQLPRGGCQTDGETSIMSGNRELSHFQNIFRVRFHDRTGDRAVEITACVVNFLLKSQIGVLLDRIQWLNRSFYNIPLNLVGCSYRLKEYGRPHIVTTHHQSVSRASLQNVLERNLGAAEEMRSVCNSCELLGPDFEVRQSVVF